MSKEVVSDDVDIVPKDVNENNVKAEINNIDEAPTTFELDYEWKWISRVTADPRVTICMIYTWYMPDILLGYK